MSGTSDQRLGVDRVDLKDGTGWLDHTKNGTPRGVPLNKDAVELLDVERGKHPVFCFTFRGEPIAWEMTNSAWHTAIQKAGISGFPVSRPPAYVGVVAPPGRYELR
jgi:integrase